MKKNMITLIRNFFLSGMGSAEALTQIRALSTEDRLQLASAIARHENLTPDQLDFEPVEY